MTTAEVIIPWGPHHPSHTPPYMMMTWQVRPFLTAEVVLEEYEDERNLHSEEELRELLAEKVKPHGTRRPYP